MTGRFFRQNRRLFAVIVAVIVVVLYLSIRSDSSPTLTFTHNGQLHGAPPSSSSSSSTSEAELDHVNQKVLHMDPDPKFPGTVFIKTHKTASSTVANILSRRAWLDELRVFISKSCGSSGTKSLQHVKHPKYTNSSCRYDVLKDHSIYEDWMIEVFENKPFLTILREPVDRYVSSINWLIEQVVVEGHKDNGAYKFFYLQNRTLLDVCHTPEIQSRVPDSPNWQLHQLVGDAYTTEEGLDRGIELLQSFSMVAIQERFDESMILFSVMFHLSLEEVAYLPLRLSTASEHYFDPHVDSETRKCLADTNELDVKLYQSGVEVFEKRMVQHGLVGRKLEGLLKEYRKVLKRTESKCSGTVAFLTEDISSNDGVTGGEGGGGTGDDVNPECVLLLMGNEWYDMFFRTRQLEYGTDWSYVRLLQEFPSSFLRYMFGVDGFERLADTHNLTSMEAEQAWEQHDRDSPILDNGELEITWERWRGQGAKLVK